MPSRRYERGGIPTRWSGRNQEAHPKVREWLGSPAGGLGEVGWPTLRSRRGQVGQTVGRKASEVCPRGPGWVWRPIWWARRRRNPTCRPRKGPKDHPDVRESHTRVWEGSGGPPGGLGVVGRPSRRFGMGWEAHAEVWETHPDVREGSGGPPIGPGGVGDPPGGPVVIGRPTRRSGRPTQRCRRGRHAHPDVQEVSVDPPRGSEGVGRPIWRSGRGLEAHPLGTGVVGSHTKMPRRDQEAHPEVQEGSGGPP